MGPRRENYDTGVKERPGWLVPVAVLLATGFLCVIFLVYYFLPNPTSFIEEHASPTPRTDRIRLAVGGIELSVPANYLVFSSARSGGTRRDASLFAALPDLRGYSEQDAALFAGNGANSPVIHILIREEAFDLPESARLERIYLAEVNNPRGARGHFGLLEYSFRNDSGYRDEDLFVGRTAPDVVVMRCERKSENVPSPNCFRELPLAQNVTLSYRFKRSRLEHWREIALGVKRLVSSFVAAAK